MIYWYEKATGKIRQCAKGKITEGARKLFPADSGVAVIELDDITEDPAEFLIEGKQLVRRPAAPAPHHVFDYKAKKWVGDADVAWTHIRIERDAKLAKTDFRVIRAVEDGKPMTKAWKDYRQALRDITEQPDPFNIAWPVEPSAAT